ncbi:MAG: ATP-binding cassette domain-containing protein, partial [Gemmatimonadetes bacterium]|nr:ATP-binding cassette domain-containing protein [Gemmatimonadota bacterium]NIT89558.1 ATP-binding cassette domain-containing protein [Gemmatimonadota bacterium]NIU33571.1 ATP-binding cassette domain-containing protein [Gemmatimonadota bacterium]NIU37995.1 ATP-binding cassette domain-containing protein [Gemmatimonadota bacterium]NIV63902.1 ATP-binding cassette domain-containing protein [Gemmatimonadota bacterium]
MTEPAAVAPARPGSDAAIRAHSVARRFGPRWALRDVDLAVEWGRAVALVGPNGSGKTTLLRILAGALTPSRGRVWIAGRRLPEEGDAVRSAVGLLAGDAYLY